MAYIGSPDNRDFELARRLRSSVPGKGRESESTVSDVERALTRLVDARGALRDADREVASAEVDAREAIKGLPEWIRQGYYDRINVASGIGELAVNQPPLPEESSVNLDDITIID